VTTTPLPAHTARAARVGSSNAETHDHHWTPAWHQSLDLELSKLPTQPPYVQAAIRRALGKDPIAFGIIYFGHHLRDTVGQMSFSEIHYEWASLALQWDRTNLPPLEPQEQRDAIVGPRESGKSTWWFLILPLWAAANEHKKFAAAFADTATQAEAHLLTMRTEMDANPLLQHDFPLLTRPTKRRSGGTVADRGGMIHMASGFVFAAKGMDSGMLGMKVGTLRPDLLIFDDIEPDEKNYSADVAEKRLGTLLDACLPLNIRASVVMVGMPGSIMHQCVKAARGTEVEDWIADEKLRCHYYPAILHDDEGEPRSIWPQKWPLSWLLSIRHTRSYAKNYENDPMAREGVYWVRSDFRIGDLTGCTKTALFIDPAVTSKKTSDFSGLCVASYRPAESVPIPTGRRHPTTREPLFRHRTTVPSQVVIRYSRGVKLTGQHLKDFVVSKVLPAFPKIRVIFVESNQGGDLWQDIFGDIPGIQVVQHNSSTSKEVRFGEALEFWQRGRVHHSQHWDRLEEEAVGFPKAANDDTVDAACSAVRYFLLPDASSPVDVMEMSTV
jgi:hypothetical protein